MARTNDEKRAYMRGYYAASRHWWPGHRPPLPPDEVIGPILKAAQDLRDALDAEIVTFLDDEPIVEKISPLIDNFDEAMTNLSHWLRDD